MMKIFSFLAVAAMLAVSCHHEPSVQPTDLKAEMAAINEVFDNLYASIISIDTSSFSPLMAEEALVLGSDPSEFLTKQDILKVLAGFAGGPVPDFNFISNREIRISDDGKSAVVVDQYLSQMFTPRIPWRVVAWVIKTDNQWKIHFFSSSLIPKNEDLATLNNAMNN